MIWRHEVEVHGLPVAKGSTRAFMVRGKPIITSTAKGLAAWQDRIVEACLRATPGWIPSKDPVQVSMTFALPRPKSARRPWPSVRPDLDKLVRAVLDAITGVLIVDDSQVVALVAGKEYAVDRPAGLRLAIEGL